MADLMIVAADLEQKIDAAQGASRLKYQPQLTRVMEQMKQAGLQVPGRLRRLEANLIDEAIEDRFDNMPV